MARARHPGPIIAIWRGRGRSCQDAMARYEDRAANCVSGTRRACSWDQSDRCWARCVARDWRQRCAGPHCGARAVARQHLKGLAVRGHHIRIARAKANRRGLRNGRAGLWPCKRAKRARGREGEGAILRRDKGPTLVVIVTVIVQDCRIVRHVATRWGLLVHFQGNAYGRRLSRVRFGDGVRADHIIGQFRPRSHGGMAGKQRNTSGSGEADQAETGENSVFHDPQYTRKTDDFVFKMWRQCVHISMLRKTHVFLEMRCARFGLKQGIFAAKP